MPIDFSKYGTPVKSEQPKQVDFSKYGTPITATEEPSQKGGVLGAVGRFAKGLAKPFVETGVKVAYQVPKSIFSTIKDPLAEPDLSLNVPLYGKVEGPSSDAKKEILKSIGTGAEMISYGIGGGAVKKGVTAFGKQTALQLAKKGAIEGAKIGALGSSGAQLAESGELSGETVKAGLIGAGAGAAIGGAVPLIAKGAQSAYEKGNSYLAGAVADNAEKVQLLKSKVPDSRVATKKLVSGKVVTDKVAKEAVRQGIPDADVALIKNASSTDKSKMAKMLDIRESQMTNKRVTERATDVVGDTFLEQAKHIEKVNKQAGKNLNVVAQRLSGKKVDASRAITGFADDLEKSGVKVRADGTLNFKNSDFEGIKSAQQAINNVWNRAIRVANKGDALELHRTKTYIDEIVSYGKNAEGLSGKAENILKGFRRNADGVLDTKFPAYNKANTIYAETIGELNKVGQVMGKKFRINEPFADAKAGITMRRIMSNTQSRSEILKTLDSMQGIARKYGMKIDDDIVNQAAFADTLEKAFGSEAPTSFLGGIERGLEGAREVGGIAGDLARGKPVAAASRAIMKGLELAKGVTRENRMKALRELLKVGAKKATVFGKK